jgi:hypothetical protein
LLALQNQVDQGWGCNEKSAFSWKTDMIDLERRKKDEEEIEERVKNLRSGMQVIRKQEELREEHKTAGPSIAEYLMQHIGHIEARITELERVFEELKDMLIRIVAQSDIKSEQLAKMVRS